MPWRSTTSIWMSLWNTWKNIWTVSRYPRLLFSSSVFFFPSCNRSVISQVCDPDVAIAFSIFLWSSCCSPWSCWMCCPSNDVSTYCSGCEACIAVSFKGDNYFFRSPSSYMTYDILTSLYLSQTNSHSVYFLQHFFYSILIFYLFYYSLG